MILRTYTWFWPLFGAYGESFLTCKTEIANGSLTIVLDKVNCLHLETPTITQCLGGTVVPPFFCLMYDIPRLTGKWPLV
jgi:hypothetical protein